MHVTMHKDISTAVIYLGGKMYRKEYLTVLNDIDWLPCIRELSNYFCFDYVGSLIMNHEDIGNEDSGRGNVYFDRGKASAQYQKRQKYFCIVCSRLPYSGPPTSRRIDYIL